MKIVFAFVVVVGLSGCAGMETPAAPPVFAAAPTPSWARAAPPSPSRPQRDGSRLPLPGDTGFAWDKLYHRGGARWECRATPSGQFVRQSFCRDLPQVEGHRPEAFLSTEGWDGMVHAD